MHFGVIWARLETIKSLYLDEKNWGDGRIWLESYDCIQNEVSRTIIIGCWGMTNVLVDQATTEVKTICLYYEHNSVYAALKY